MMHSRLAPPAYVVGIVTHSPNSADQCEQHRDKTQISSCMLCPLTLDKLLVNALTEALDIGCMDEEFADE